MTFLLGEMGVADGAIPTAFGRWAFDSRCANTEWSPPITMSETNSDATEKDSQFNNAFTHSMSGVARI